MQCFYAHSLDLVVRTARLLGRTEDAAKYEALHKRAVDAFRNEYVTPNGMLVSDTQTAYTLALMFDLLPEAQRAGAAKRLVDNVNRYGHITTGFLGTPYICEVLTRFGYEDVAYELLLNKEDPFVALPISMGATTIWERWNSMLPNGMVNSNSMVSFNHYAYGAIGDWLYRWAAGLQEAAPGFREIRIKPYLNDHFTSMKAEQRTPYGLASSGWTKEGDALTLTVEIPANTTAEVYVPVGCCRQGDRVGPRTRRPQRSESCGLGRRLYARAPRFGSLRVPVDAEIRDSRRYDEGWGTIVLHPVVLQCDRGRPPAC